MVRFLLAGAAAVLLFTAVRVTPGAGAQSPLPQRAVMAFVAAGEPVPTLPTPARATPPPGAGYCGPSAAVGAPPFPPNSVFGLLTIGGAPAPAGTVVYLTFDSQPGPGVYTLAEGGYVVRYAAGGQGHVPRCINEVGSELGILVNGIVVNSGILVGDSDFGLAFRFDIDVP